MARSFLICVSLLFLTVSGSIPNLDQTSLVYISPQSSAFMEIKSNPTTGYSWYMFPLNSHKMKVADPNGEYIPSKLAIGGGGVQRFEIICNHLCEHGDTEKVAMVYARPWETKDHATAKEITIQVSTDPRLA